MGDLFSKRPIPVTKAPLPEYRKSPRFIKIAFGRKSYRGFYLGFVNGLGNRYIVNVAIKKRYRPLVRKVVTKCLGAFRPFGNNRPFKNTLRPWISPLYLDVWLGLGPVFYGSDSTYYTTDVWLVVARTT